MKTLEQIALTREADLDPSFVALCKSITAKRARTVIDHILTHGVITNEDLSATYGYDHPPRAIRDVRENGIPLITHKVVSTATGRKIGAYTFDDPSRIKHGRIGGRKAFSKQFKEALLSNMGLVTPSRASFSTPGIYKSITESRIKSSAMPKQRKIHRTSCLSTARRKEQKAGPANIAKIGWK